VDAGSSGRQLASGSGIHLYLSRQASSLGRYAWEQLVLSLLGWVPTVVGVGLRALAYRLIMRLDGIVAIERGVRIRFASHVRLGKGVYLDEGVYLHACPGGIEIGENTFAAYLTPASRSGGTA
jgi:acetyltransferase-like isoleucine patch superfamily enzyme